MKILTNVLLGRNSKVTQAIGYIDTGNSLRCNLTKRYVSIATYAVVSALLERDEFNFVNHYIKDSAFICEKNTDIPKGIHIIPYNTICDAGKLMLAIDADFMFVNDDYIEKKPLIGISTTTFNIQHTDKCILLNKKYIKRGKRNVKHSSR